MNVNEEGFSTSENDIDSKFTKLQRNHRRLLGVTSALTEALESTVRGEDFDLEETLNECMKIYPELFVQTDFSLKESKYYRSEASFTGGSTEFQNFNPNKYGGSIKYNNNSTFLNNNYRTPSVSVRSESEASEGRTSYSESAQFKNHKRKANASKRHTEDFTSNLRDDEVRIKSGPSASFLILSPEYKQERFSFKRQLFKTNEQRNSVIPNIEENPDEAQEVVDENSYDVKHPDSDTDFRKKRQRSPDVTIKCLDPNENKIQEVVIGETSNDEGRGGKQYEIIVKPGLSPRQTQETFDGNLTIKIKPEYNAPDDKPGHMNSPKFITQPLETCIIITNHVEPEFNVNSENLSIKSESKNQYVNANLSNMTFNRFTTKNDTIDKLQKLSTGLKVRSDEIVPEIAESDSCIEKSIQNEFGNQNLIHSPSVDKPAIERNSENYYNDIKQTLINGSVKDKVLILQKLRLTLIHTLAKERAEVLNSYIENDILCLKDEKPLLNNVLPSEIVNGWDLILQQMFLKFLNTICSTWKGRDYLTSNTKTMSCLLNNFYEECSSKSSDVVSNDMLSGTFHKMLTRQNQLAVFFNSGAMEKIFYGIVEGHDSMTPYRLRHSLGILINSCTFSNGRNATEHLSSEMFGLLVTLLNNRDKKTTPYIARLIYVLMANEKFHKRAKEIDLLTTLEKSMNMSNKRLKLQYDILKTVIDQPKPHDFLCGTEDNFLSNIEAEMDELEEEVESGEPNFFNSQMENHDNIKLPNRQQSNESNKIKVDNDSNSNVGKKSNLPTYVRGKNRIKKDDDKKVDSRNVPKREDKIINQTKNNTGAVAKKPVQKLIKNKAPPLQSKSKPTIRPGTVTKKKHEIVESPDGGAKSYVLLNEDSEKFDKEKRNVEIVNESIESKDAPKEPGRSNEIVNNDDKQKNENESSFVVLGENFSESSDTNGLSECSSSPDQMPLPVDILKSDELLDNASLNSQIFNNESNPDVSVFIRQGKISEIEYDYCEATKEIQSPIKYDNIFKNNRQSPYKGLLIESQKPILFNRPKIKIKRPSNESESNKTDEQETSESKNSSRDAFPETKV